ncbi:anaerobic ribonucleoside-triphosphate reductase activating protein [Microbulbifer yueqingensis]|uniref:Pyruvate formate lyase activating enzyme n=1 Tax=Microbulbifer yueqingensis TaxID=658219 RepID=A0A1G8XIC3_9GAMM|nr:anaerobic ribonucleoside-triphosphate reductase activating protein [Microbulbifer yueqingensis]SDJ90342.1 pyruvate formate lyase activating enzyme [Microbulbifer yueqingensis]
MSDSLRVGGFTPFTAIDYPGALAAVVFCQGCPWRCRYCHNSELLPARAPTPYRWSKLLAFLRGRSGLLDAVVFSGGEPTAQRALESAMTQVRELGFKVGLHTAGMYPRRLQGLLPQLDWVGLDIKALPENYPAITGVEKSGATSWDSARLLAEAGIPLQVRLTRHPQLTSEAELDEVRRRLADLGISDLVVQGCNTERCLDQKLRLPH